MEGDVNGFLLKRSVKKTHMTAKPSLPPFKALVALECVVRHRSVSRAAEELCVTHGAVSKQLALLTDWLGRPLFTDTHCITPVARGGHGTACHRGSIGYRARGGTRGAGPSHTRTRQLCHILAHSATAGIAGVRSPDEGARALYAHK